MPRQKSMRMSLFDHAGSRWKVPRSRRLGGEMSRLNAVVVVAGELHRWIGRWVNFDLRRLELVSMPRPASFTPVNTSLF